MPYTLTQLVATRVTLTPDKASPQIAGAPITFTAAASPAGGVYEYRFWLRDPRGKWVVAQPYSAANQWSWNPSGAVGQYKVRVDARVQSSTANFQARREIGYKLNALPPVRSITLTANKPSPQPRGSVVTFTAQANGGSGQYEYRFLTRGPNGTWVPRQSYSTNNTFTWTAPLIAGEYSIRVQARNVGSTANFEATRNMSYRIR
jgi:hypothetical protein